MVLTFKLVTEPECKTFLKIKEGGDYYTIDDFISKHGSDSEEVLNNCDVWYRGTEKSHKQTIDGYVKFSEGLEFYTFQPPMLVMDNSIQASIYFVKKAKDCLQIARFFTMKSVLLLDTNFNLHWSQGYVPQFWFRCIYFGTATTWYANCFDHILQIAYWGLKLYTAVTDRDGVVYDESWDAKKTMGLCTYEFVVGELKVRGLTDVRKYLTSCSGKIDEVRQWSNYIKHKGGIDYKYLEAPPLFHAIFQPNDGGRPIKMMDFKSPLEVDIDEKLPKLKEAHIALYQCLDEIITVVDFNENSVQFINKEDSPNE